jgi:hypothetical protein
VGTRSFQGLVDRFRGWIHNNKQVPLTIKTKSPYVDIEVITVKVWDFQDLGTDYLEVSTICNAFRFVLQILKSVQI